MTDSSSEPGAGYHDTAAEELFGVLSERAHRVIVRYLAAQDAATVDELAAAVPAVSPDDRSERQLAVEDRQTALRERYLPTLVEVGLVRVEDDRVRLAPAVTDSHWLRALVDGSQTQDGVSPAADSTEAGDATRNRATQVTAATQTEMFSTLVSNLPGIAYRCANERGWPMAFVSEGCRELTGYEPAALESERLSWGEDIVHPEDSERVWQEVQRALDRGEQFEVTYRIVRKDGAERWVWEQGQQVPTADGERADIEGFITDITDQKERERRLEAVFNQTYQFTGLMKPDGTLLKANETALEFGGLDRADVIGSKIWDTYWWQVDETKRAKLRDAVERAAGGEFVRYEATVQGEDGLRIIDFSLRPVTDEDGDVELLIPEGRDITELKQREGQLESLNEIAGELTTVESVTEVCELAVEAARETLELDLAAVERFDEEQGSLESCARTASVTELLGDEPLFDTEQNKAWQAYLEQEGTVYEDLRARTEAPKTGTGTPLDSAIVLPLARHGVFVVGSTTPGAFTDADIDLARILASHTEIAMDLLDRERSLRQRTETLERKTARLERLNSVNEVIRGLTQTLVTASNRAEIEQEACACLANGGPYQFAWFGTRDPVSDELRPAATAGTGDAYLDSITVTVGADGADAAVAARAFRQQEPAVVDPIRVDPPFEPWQQAALDCGFRSVIAVPVTYEGTRYGVLTVYGDEPDVFDEFQRRVIAELGETLGYAITAAERKAGLMSDRTHELRFSITEPEGPLLRYLQQVGGEAELRSVIQEGDSSRLFITLRDCSPAAFCELAVESPGLQAANEISGDESESVVECVPAGETIVDRVREHGAVLRDIEVDEGQVTVTVELPANRSVREFARMFESQYRGATLVARREHDRPLRTVQGLRDDITAELTDRQLEAIKTAYYGGFFEWPRESTGEEVATMLDVSQPTFNRHLRTGLAKLFGQLLGER